MDPEPHVRDRERTAKDARRLRGRRRSCSDRGEGEVQGRGRSPVELGCANAELRDGAGGELARPSDLCVLDGAAAFLPRDHCAGRRGHGEDGEEDRGRRRHEGRAPVLAYILSDQLVLRPTVQRRRQVGDHVAEAAVLEREIVATPREA